MNHTRVFVTYLPTPPQTRPVSTATRPLVAIIAGALTVGGGAHSVRGDGDTPAIMAPLATTPPRVRLTMASLPFASSPGSQPRAKQSTGEPGGPVVIEAPPAARPVHLRQLGHRENTMVPAMPADHPPRATPRRDLAGFLAQQGLTLATTARTLGSGETTERTTTISDALEDTAALMGAVQPVAAASSVTSAVLPEGADAEQTFPTVSVDGQALGAITMRDGKLHLAALVGLLELKLPAGEFERLKAAPAADSFVDFEMLRDAGITATLDPSGMQVTLTAS